MPLPQPEDFADRILALERAVKDLRTSLTTQGGFTSASAGLAFLDQGTPDPPASGGHLHANGDDPYWTDAGGNTRAIIPRGTGVVDTTAATTNPPSTYTPAHIQTITDSIENLASTLNALLSSLRGAGLIDPF